MSLASDILGLEKPLRVARTEKEAAEAPRASVYGASEHTSAFHEMADGAPPAAVRLGGQFSHGSQFDQVAEESYKARHVVSKGRAMFDAPENAPQPATQFAQVHGSAASPSSEQMRAELEQLSARYEKLESAADFDEAAPEAQRLLRRMEELSDQYAAAGGDEDEKEAEE